MFIKTIIKQGEKIIKLEKENKKIAEENRQHREFNNEISLIVFHLNKLIDNTMRNCYNIQELERIESKNKEEKSKHKSNFLNQIIKENLSIKKELDSLCKRI